MIQEKILVKTVVPITKVIDSLLQIEIGQTMSEDLLVFVKQSASEAFALLSFANTELLQMPRDDIVFKLSPEYKQLRVGNEKGSAFLFGDNLNDRITTIAKSNKATRNLSGKPEHMKSDYTHQYKVRYYPYSKNQGPISRKQSRLYGKRQYKGRKGESHY